MGSPASKQEDSENKNVTNDEIVDKKTPTDEEQNEYKGDTEGDREPVIEDEVVPTDGIQVRSFIGAPTICPPGYRMDAKGKCRKVQ